MGTDWKVIWGLLRKDINMICFLMAAASVGVVMVLWRNDRIYMAIGGAISMIPAAYLDSQYYKLYHRLTLGMLLWGLFLSLILEIFVPANQLITALSGLICMGIMFGFLYFFTGQIGFGDVCYGVALGTFLGWQGSIVAFVLTFALGLVAALREYVYHACYGKWRRRKLPLGPFMACGTYISLLCGQELLEWYTGIC